MNDTQFQSDVHSDLRPDLAATLTSLPASSVLRAFATAVDVEELIAACLAELQLVIPQLQPWRGRLNGRRVLGLHTPAEHGQPVQLGFTRVDIEFEVVTDGPAVALTCRSTTRGRDREATHARIVLDADGEARVAAWVEDALLVFAASHFESRRNRRR